MSSPCNQQPIQWVSCCQVVDCLNLTSSNNSIEVQKTDCGVDIKVTGNNLDSILKLNDGDCVSWVKEFVNGVLNFTPQIDLECLAPAICNICAPAITCPAPLFLSVSNV